MLGRQISIYGPSLCRSVSYAMEERRLTADILMKHSITYLQGCYPEGYFRLGIDFLQDSRIVISMGI